MIKLKNYTTITEIDFITLINEITLSNTEEDLQCSMGTRRTTYNLEQANYNEFEISFSLQLIIDRENVVDDFSIDELELWNENGEDLITVSNHRFKILEKVVSDILSIRYDYIRYLKK